ncbi:MAG: hypothetical protein VST67_13940 [Nitrospirota bacterium]|nr:hypothetical protein [Nitrospirota bacterium]
MFKKPVLAEAKSPPSKASLPTTSWKASHLCLLHPAGGNHGVTRGAYSQYVSTAQWRERRWWFFQHSLLLSRGAC